MHQFIIVICSFVALFPLFCNGAPVLMDEKSPLFMAAIKHSQQMKQMLDQIKIAALKKHGLYTEKDPTKLLKRTELVKKLTKFSDGTELSVNREIADELFEGDILLSHDQAQQILREIENSPDMKRIHPRQANPQPKTFWHADMTIPYTIKTDKNDTILATMVRLAQQHISSLTCIRFAYHKNASELVGKDYLEYFRHSGCWSMVGRQGGAQQVSIGHGCEVLGIVAHETLHALGLWHEQSRTDQDQYVTIMYDNILPGTQSNFYKRTPDTSDNMGQPYDLGSVMHYSNMAFAKDYKSYTIFAKDPAYQQTMGSRVGLSFKDAKMINMRYCSKKCNLDLECQNGGYTDPLKCDQCRCPDGYTGDFCQESPKSNSRGCKNTGALTAGEYLGTISTLTLVPNVKCYWMIFPESSNKRVVLNVTKLGFPCKNSCSSYVEVKAKQDKVATGARLCCGNSTTIYGDIGTDVVVILKVEEHLQGKYDGFTIGYKSVNGSLPILEPKIVLNNKPTVIDQTEVGVVPMIPANSNAIFGSFEGDSEESEESDEK